MLQHGEEDFEQEKVLALARSADDRLINAKVRGAGSSMHQVEVEVERGSHGLRYLESYCTCSPSFGCRHVVALFYAAEAAYPDLFKPSQNGSTSDEPEVPALSGPLRDWLETFKKAAAPAKAGAKPKPVLDRLYYLLDFDEEGEGNRLKVSCQKARPLKSGRNSSPQPYTFFNCLKRPPARTVQPMDARIALLITRGDPHGYMRYATESILSGEEGAEILELLLRSGRCYWQSGDSTPLSLGEPRPAEPHWARNAGGSLHASFKAQPPAKFFLPLHPPWYVDPESSMCGPLQLQMTPAAAEAWLKAPLIAPQETPRLAQAMQSETGAISLPIPEAVPVEVVESVVPIPCIKLATLRLQWWELPGGFGQPSLDGVPIHYGRVSFEYRGLRIPAELPPEMFEHFDGEKVLRIERNPAAEAKAFRMLAKNEFVPDNEVFNYHRHERLLNSFILRTGTADSWMKHGSSLLPNLREAGWQVELDPTFELAIAEVTDWYADAQPDGAPNWFDVELGVKVGEEKINLLPVLLEALKKQGNALSLDKLQALKPGKLIPIRLPDNRILPFPAGRLREILSILLELFDPKSLDKSNRLKLPKLRVAELAGLDGKEGWNWFGGETLRELARKMKSFQGITRVVPPSGLRAELRPYQQDGLSWLQFLREYELSGILADDMGLGKTVQALAHLLVEKEAGRLDKPAIVIAPTSLMVNWRQEAERFAPTLRTLVLHGPDRKSRFADIPAHDLVLTTYPLLPRDAEYLLGVEFHCAILDEAQFIKNPKTQWAQLVCQLQARHRLCLTGTPMENHLGELWSLFNFLLPGFLGDETRFRALFRNPIERGSSEDRRQLLARRVAPFLLRRRKEEVAKELPPKTEIAQNVELGGAQRDLYESIRLAMHQRVREEVEKKGMSRSHIIILDALLKLRQVCCDPRLLPLESARKVTESAKLDLLMDLIPEMLAEGRRILLFSQFTSMLALIEQRLAAEKIDWVKLTGSTTDRATPVNRFQNGEVPLFLISLKAGGTGLNLTAADTVIHYDPWWNPAVENQATDRAHRIGQEKTVFVYKLLTVGTVEEKIVSMQAKKRELVEGLLNEGSGKKLDLSADDIDFLFAPLS
jgi:superfamily II DNA or RNA helicase